MLEFALQVVLALLLVSILLWTRRTRFLKPNGSELQGPPYQFPFGHFFDLFTSPTQFGPQSFAQYGSIYRIWWFSTPAIVLADPQDIHLFYQNQLSPFTPHTKSKNFGIGYLLESILGDCIGIMYGKKWKHIRSMFDPFFTPRRASDFVRDTFMRECQRSLSKIGSDTSSAVSLRQELCYLVLHSIGMMVYGNYTDSIRKELENLLEVHEHLVTAIFKDTWTFFLRSSWFPTKTNKRLQDFNMAWKNFNNRFEKEELRDDMEILKKLFLQRDEGKLTEKELLHSLDEIVLTNVDVTSAGLYWALVYIAAHPDIQNKIRDEIRQNISSEDSKVNYINSKKSYLTNVIKELARIQPLVGFTFPEMASTDLTLGGYHIPAGTPIVVDYFSLHSHPQYWNEPMEFKPERWETENFETTQRFAYNRDGLGKRKCIGQFVSASLTKCFIVETLQNWQISIPTGVSNYKQIDPACAFITPITPIHFTPIQTAQ